MHDLRAGFRLIFIREKKDQMRRLGSVQQKIPCVFLTEVKGEQSRKRDGQVSAVLVAARFLN